MGIHADADRPRKPDRVAELDLALLRQAGIHEIVRRISLCAYAYAIDTRGVLATERCATHTREITLGA